MKDIASIARVVHEANRAYCEMIGDFSQQPWEQAAEWQRESAIDGVAKFLSGELPTPEAQHDAWVAFKVQDGWRYGEVKDAERKTHPCMVPYEQLPPEQKRKDHLFRAICAALTEPVT